MRVVVAPDELKGSLTAAQMAARVAADWMREDSATTASERS
jgi:glycerate kinase